MVKTSILQKKKWMGNRPWQKYRPLPALQYELCEHNMNTEKLSSAVIWSLMKHTEIHPIRDKNENQIRQKTKWAGVKEK